jgi:hypothetical protein
MFEECTTHRCDRLLPLSDRQRMDRADGISAARTAAAAAAAAAAVQKWRGIENAPRSGRGRVIFPCEAPCRRDTMRADGSRAGAHSRAREYERALCLSIYGIIPGVPASAARRPRLAATPLLRPICIGDVRPLLSAAPSRAHGHGWAAAEQRDAVFRDTLYNAVLFN